MSNRNSLREYWNERQQARWNRNEGETYSEYIVRELNISLEHFGRSERAEVRDDHVYFCGMTVLEHWADWCDCRPASWVCTDHTNPNETVVRNHREHEGEKWSGSFNVWHQFVVSTLCHIEGCGWTGDYRDGDAWVFDPIANPPYEGRTISVQELASLMS